MRSRKRVSMSMSIHDGNSLDAEALLYDDRSDGLTTVQPNQFVETRVIYIAGHAWTLRFTSAPDYGITNIDKLIPSGIVTLVRLEHSSNVNSPMLVTPLGIIRLARLEQ